MQDIYWGVWGVNLKHKAKGAITSSEAFHVHIVLICGSLANF